MFIKEIWRYPVKSMAGESLSESAVGPMGISGDRLLYVRDALGNIVTARTNPKLLLHHTSLDAHGEPTVDGLPWQHPDVAKLVADAAGNDGQLARARSGERFDVLPLLIATDGMVSALNVDRRRLRPNLLIGGVEKLAEQGWQGKVLRIRECGDRSRQSSRPLRHDHVGSRYRAAGQEGAHSNLPRVRRCSLP